MAGRVATYRIQLTPDFGFAAAESVVADLARLGVSHLYLSPVADAVPGSTHGYDVIDPESVREELGGRDALWSLAGCAAEHGLSLFVDIVPNHISSYASPHNRWWWELLRDGRSASTEPYFDVDWDAGDGRILLPVLGQPLDVELASGAFAVAPDRASIRWHDQRFPVHGGGNSDDLAAVLAEQSYRLTEYHDPPRNVRRFFAIDQLVGVRPEVPAVAEAIHRTVLDLAADQLLDGVRLDHIDGLADPTAYLHGLRTALGDDAWILVEKIVVGDERLCTDWRVDGTTGYEWIALVDHLFTHPDGEETFTRLWRDATGDETSYHEHEANGVREVLAGILRPETDRLARTAAAEANRHGSTVEPDRFVTPIIELTAHLGRYRTYLGSRLDTDETSDVALVRRAQTDAARALDSSAEADLAAFVDLVLAGGDTTRRWQQLSGPALAKGGEDQALYRSMRFGAHNEVGGDPGSWSAAVDTFHDHNGLVVAERAEPLLAGSTHDTKRSEDVRSRLLALTDTADRWAEVSGRWSRQLPGPDGWSTTLALQTAVAAWPIDATRLGDYLVKAAREAGTATAWLHPDTDHENALRGLATDLTAGPLATEVAAFVDSIDPAARAISLAQLALRLTAPGVPDLYQCSESWLHTLVDPDNRRPLDPATLASSVDAARRDGDVWSSAAPKAALIARVLDVRRRHPECFAPGSPYHPVDASGRHADHVVAFARGADVAVVVARFPTSRPQGWRDTTVTLPAGRWVDALTDRTVPGDDVALGDLLGAERCAAVLEHAGTAA